MNNEPSGTRGSSVSSDVDDLPVEGVDEEFKPWTAEEVAVWRQRQRPVSVYQPLMWQLLLGGLAVVVAWAWFPDRAAVAKSVLYGVAAVLVPAGMFARALMRQQRSAKHALQALSSLMLWEGVKIVLTIALLLAAPRVVKELIWPALLVGFVVTVKAAWLGWWWQMRAPQAGSAR